MPIFQKEDALSAVTMINWISADRDRPLLVHMTGTHNTSGDVRDVFGVPQGSPCSANPPWTG